MSKGAAKLVIILTLIVVILSTVFGLWLNNKIIDDAPHRNKSESFIIREFDKTIIINVNNIDKININNKTYTGDELADALEREVFKND